MQHKRGEVENTFVHDIETETSMKNGRGANKSVLRKQCSKK